MSGFFILLIKNVIIKIVMMVYDTTILSTALPAFLYL
jgi:hypothetical protein